jgi:hypothetical protein
MINLSLSIKNPFAKDLKKTFSFSKNWKITKYKVFEFQFCRLANYHCVSFHLDLAWRGQSHAGPLFELEFFGYELIIKIYDTRHWNYKKGTWENYES